MSHNVKAQDSSMLAQFKSASPYNRNVHFIRTSIRSDAKRSLVAGD